jgi:hypothetical protein
MVISGHFKLMRALLLLTLNILNKEKLQKEGVSEEEAKESSGPSKKKKGKGG